MPLLLETRKRDKRERQERETRERETRERDKRERQERESRERDKRETKERLERISTNQIFCQIGTHIYICTVTQQTRDKTT